MAWQGGSQGQYGDRVDNGHDYYPRGVNKGAVAYAKGNILSTDHTTGNAILAPTTGARPPYYVAYAATIAADPRQHAWHQEGEWLVLETTGNLTPNCIVKPSTTEAGKLEKLVVGTDDITLLGLGIYMGTIDMHAELVSNNVVQTSAVDGDYCVINFRRL